MNYWEYNSVSTQDFEITPREFTASASSPFTADTTLYTADSTLQTADATVVVGANPVLNIQYQKDGVYVLKNANATFVRDGDVLTLSAVLDVDKDAFYYFKVFSNGAEIYRGKSFTFDILPSEPLHYSIYN